jgi:hypothetical protein
METIIVIIIIAAAAGWLGRRAVRTLKCKGEGCGCADNCRIAGFCDKNFSRPPTENQSRH